MNGMIFIPDISGFTNMVKKIDMDLGASITRQLLTTIIQNNPLDMEISEIEGDAVLYYKLGDPIPMKQLFSGFEVILNSFTYKYYHLIKQHQISEPLSLKVIVHYGPVSVFSIAHFTKLYGQTVIEAHRLLKNGSELPNYMLVTEEYLQALRSTNQTMDAPERFLPSQKCTMLQDLRKICFWYYYPVDHEFKYVQHPAKPLPVKDSQCKTILQENNINHLQTPNA